MRFASSGALSLLLSAACGGSSSTPNAQAPVAVTEVSLEAEGRAEGVPSDENDPAAENLAAIEKMQSAGVLGALSSEQGDAFVALLGTSGLDEIGGLQGATVGEAFGAGGLGLSGVGTGGGGTGQPIGLGTIGRSAGPGTGGAAGTGSGAGFSGYGSGRTRSGPVPKVKLGAPTVQGALDPELVRRVLRRHLAAFHYCYESEQVKSPQLAGEVRVAFTIGAGGAVAAASVASSTLQSAAVESCLVGRMKTMAFPEPEKGVVLVEVSMEFSTPPPPPAAPPASPPAPPASRGGAP